VGWTKGHAVAQWLRHYATAGRLWVWDQMRWMSFFPFTQSFRPH
jgi:hypothetical protein